MDATDSPPSSDVQKAYNPFFLLLAGVGILWGTSTLATLINRSRLDAPLSPVPTYLSLRAYEQELANLRPFEVQGLYVHNAPLDTRLKEEAQTLARDVLTMRTSLAETCAVLERELPVREYLATEESVKNVQAEINLVSVALGVGILATGLQTVRQKRKPLVPADI